MGPSELIRWVMLMKRLAKVGGSTLNYNGVSSNQSGPVYCIRKHTESGAFFDCYRHQKYNRSTWVIVPGVTVNGGEESRLVQFAYSLASCGITCVVPTLKGLSSCRWISTDIDALVEIIIATSNHFQKPVGLVGFSYGSSYCLLAAARLKDSQQIDHIISFGAYHNIKTLLEEYIKAEKIKPMTDEEWDNRIFQYLALLQGYGGLSFPPSVQQAMQSLLRRYCNEASLQEKKNFYQEHLKKFEMTHLIQRLMKTGEIEKLSPADVLPGIKCPITLIHQNNDPLIPLNHSIKLYYELKNLPNPERFRLIKTKFLSHVSPKNIFPLREALKLSIALTPLIKKT